MQQKKPRSPGSWLRGLEVVEDGSELIAGDAQQFEVFVEL